MMSPVGTLVTRRTCTSSAHLPGQLLIDPILHPPVASGRPPGPDASRHAPASARRGTPRPGAGHHGPRWRPDNPTSLGPLPLSYEDGDFFPIKYFMTQRDLMGGAVSESAMLAGGTRRGKRDTRSVF